MSKHQELFLAIRAIVIVVVIAWVSAHPLSANTRGSSATGEGARKL